MMEKNMINRWFGLIVSAFMVSVPAWAVDDQRSLGGVASGLLSAEKSATAFIGFICVVAGIALCVASIGLFYSHWRNPGQVPLSKPVSMVFLGLALIGLSFIPMGA